MSEQEKYEELIRQKFAEKEFIFNEENWEKAEKMLDSGKRSKKIFGWSMVFLIGVVTGSFLMFFLTREGQHSAKNDAHAVLKNTRRTEEITTPLNRTTSNDQKSNSSSSQQTTETANGNEDPLTTTSPKTENEPEFHSSANENRTDAKTHKTTIAPSKVKGNRSNEMLTNAEQLADEDTRSAGNDLKKHKQTSTLSGKEDMAKATKKIKNKKSVSRDESPEVAVNSEVSGKDAVIGTNKKLKTKNTASGKNTTTEKEETATLALNKTKKSSGKKVAKTVVKDTSSEQAKETVEAMKGEQAAADSSAQLAVTAETAKEDVASTDSVKQQEIALVSADSTLKADSVVTPPIAKENVVAPSLPLDGLATTTIFSMDAGAHAQLGWQYSDTIEGRGITPIAGISLTHYFNQKWSAVLGVQYNCIAYLKASTKNITSTTYSFGAVTTSATVKPGILNYVNVPFLIQYHFNNANAVLIGGTGGLLLNKKSAVETQTFYTTPDSTNPSYKTYYQNYYKHSFNSYYASVCVGYRRKISSHFNLTAMIHYGLSDVKKNTFFLRNAVERDSGLKLILSYNIFDF